jgi:UDP-3-O-[3-hydroxymyristoyl] glucosamine N-acyltransferase
MVTRQALATRLGGRLLGDDGEVQRIHLMGDEPAQATTLAIVLTAAHRRAAFSCADGALLCDVSFAAHHAHELSCAVVAVDDVGTALGVVLRLLSHADPSPSTAPRGIHPTALIEPGAALGDDVEVGAFSVVRSCARIGHRVRIGTHCSIGESATLFAQDAGDEVPALAGVVLGDDVVVASHVSMHRGFVRNTVVGASTRIDSHVHIGHDVVMGEGCVLVAQVGIAGFVTLGAGVVVGGQAGINPHVTIAAGVRVGGAAGVSHDIHEPGAVVGGFPAQPHMAWLRQQAWLRRRAR